MPTLEEMRERYRGKKKSGGNPLWKERFEPGDEHRFSQQYMHQPEPIIKPIPADEAEYKECADCRQSNYYNRSPIDHRCPFIKDDRDANCVYLDERIDAAVRVGDLDVALKIDVWCKYCGKLMPLSSSFRVKGTWRGSWYCSIHKGIHPPNRYAIPYQELMSHRPPPPPKGF